MIGRIEIPAGLLGAPPSPPRFRPSALESMSGALNTAKNVVGLIRAYNEIGRLPPNVLTRILDDTESEMNVLFENGLKEMARLRALPHFDPYAPPEMDGPFAAPGIPYDPSGIPPTPEELPGWTKCERCGSSYALVAKDYHETTCPPVKAKLDCLLPDPTEKLPK